jgi:hypothetical protein
MVCVVFCFAARGRALGGPGPVPQYVWNSRQHVKRESLKLCLKFRTVATTSKHPRNVIGPAVRRLRGRLGWSQARLAAKCQIAGWDVSRGIVAAIEGRVRWVGDFEAALLARVLRVNVAALYPEKINWRELNLAHSARQRGS